jgi:hypothetical protein
MPSEPLEGGPEIVAISAHTLKHDRAGGGKVGLQTCDPPLEEVGVASGQGRGHPGVAGVRRGEGMDGGQHREAPARWVVVRLHQAQCRQPVEVVEK